MSYVKYVKAVDVCCGLWRVLAVATMGSDAHRLVADEKGDVVMSVYRAGGLLYWLNKPMFPFFVGRYVYTEGFRIPFYTPRLTVDATDMTLKEQNGIVWEEYTIT